MALIPYRDNYAVADRAALYGSLGAFMYGYGQAPVPYYSWDNYPTTYSWNWRDNAVYRYFKSFVEPYIPEPSEPIPEPSAEQQWNRFSRRTDYNLNNQNRENFCRRVAACIAAKKRQKPLKAKAKISGSYNRRNYDRTRRGRYNKRRSYSTRAYYRKR